MDTVGDSCLHSWLLVTPLRNKEITLTEAAIAYKNMIRREKLLPQPVKKKMVTVTCAYCHKNFDVPFSKMLSYNNHIKQTPKFFCTPTHKTKFYNKKLHNVNN